MLMHFYKNKRFITLLSCMLCLGVVLYVKVQSPEQKDQSEPVISGVQTDKARYDPGDEVNLTLHTNIKTGKLNIVYYHLDEKIGEQTITIHQEGKQSWTWSPPTVDYQGYLVKVTMESGNKVTSETIAVDVSSDWGKFPRYGFLSGFDTENESDMKDVISRLNRYHINGIQFYDWHYEHQDPLKTADGKPAHHWEDISNRPIDLDTINSYISLSHERNMTAMAYNLLYGSFENRNLPKEWHLFKDQEQREKDLHPLPEDWKTNVEIMNPTNPWWQDHLIEKQQEVYRSLSFDGWHIDQLGDRGKVYNEWGDLISLDESFEPFLNKIQECIPDKQIVMNAVNQYGQGSINRSPVPFLYTEVWNPNSTYNDIVRILDDNHHLSQGNKNTVLAAYMNYEHANKEGMFNEAGILLANSVIFANGGAHLELGEHMLSKEYFPHDSLNMTESLQQKLIDYYDFLTAYENILRDDISRSEVQIESADGIAFSPTAVQGSLWYTAKEKGKKQMIHLINLLDADSIDWRDTFATHPKPIEQKQIGIKMETDREVNKVWFASPDIDGGAPQTLPHDQKDQSLSFTLPSITYWDMVVIQYK
ncbi:glycoside hydrolase family 66 protein [Rossellomorea vietnamensis]|uniref:glycoside hydrolase family 66 protein n=1 Tax=Rossellomorea vietnamensis TaxID=218284 RepID=UPI00068ABC93|nr:glycoside hydrolase family 66 protein [Rossellomorea vietnamensis]